MRWPVISPRQLSSNSLGLISNRLDLHPPPPKWSVLPALTQLEFRGVSTPGASCPNLHWTRWPAHVASLSKPLSTFCFTADYTPPRAASTCLQAASPETSHVFRP